MLRAFQEKISRYQEAWKKMAEKNARPPAES